MSTSTVSAAAGLVMLIAAALFWTRGGRHTPRLTVALVLFGTFCILGTRVGGYLRTAVNWADGMVGQLTGQLTGAVITGLIALIALYFLCRDLWMKTVDSGTLVAAIVAPAAIGSVPGMIGDISSSAMNAGAGAAGAAIGSIFGIG